MLKQHVTLQQEPDLLIPTVLHYDPQQPTVIQFSFTLENNTTINWHIGRNLLKEGLKKEAGNGNIIITTINNLTHIQLQGENNQQATVTGNTNELQAFLTASYVILSTEEENRHISATVENLIQQLC